MRFFTSDTCMLLSDEMRSFWYLICVFLELIVIFEKSSFSKKCIFTMIQIAWNWGSDDRKFLFFQIQHKILRMFTKIRCPNSKSQLGKAGKVQKSEKNSNFWPFLVKNYPLEGRMTKNIFFFRFHIKFWVGSKKSGEQTKISLEAERFFCFFTVFSLFKSSTLN